MKTPFVSHIGLDYTAQGERFTAFQLCRKEPRPGYPNRMVAFADVTLCDGKPVRYRSTNALTTRQRAIERLAVKTTRKAIPSQF